jgi:hypothetical protein
MFNKQIVATLSAALEVCESAARTPSEKETVESYRARLIPRPTRLLSRPARPSRKLALSRRG